MKLLEQLFDSLRPWVQFCVTCAMTWLAHLDVIASIVALVVLLFQFKVVYYRGKLERLKYNKECEK